MALMKLDRMPEGDWDKIEAVSDALGQILEGCDFNVTMHSLLYMLAMCGTQLKQDGVTERQFVQAVNSELQRFMQDLTELREERGEE